MPKDIIERIQILFPDLQEINHKLSKRLVILNQEVGEEIRGQNRVIIFPKEENKHDHLKKILEKELILAELESINRLQRGYPLQEKHISALEALIDESMPFLVIKDGDFALPNGWEHLELQRPQIKKGIASVGRIGTLGSSLYWGTGFLIAPDIIATNWHVVFQHVYRSNGSWKFYPHLNVMIDFCAEMQTSKSLKVKCSKIAEKHSFYDLVLLRTEREITEVAPIPLSFSEPENLVALPIYLVGHPYIDSRLGASREIQRRLFLMDQTIGYKHLLLGYIETAVLYQPDTVLNYPQRKHFCHTGSTLPGNSGSCIIDLNSNKAIGIHCAGDNFLKKNYAIPLWEIKKDSFFDKVDIAMD